jgi:hypothetical protein
MTSRRFDPRSPSVRSNAGFPPGSVRYAGPPKVDQPTDQSQTQSIRTRKAHSEPRISARQTSRVVVVRTSRTPPR